MTYIICVLVSVLLSKLYVDLVIRKYDEVITKHIKDTSEVTFDMVMELLKKLGIIRD